MYTGGFKQVSALSGTMFRPHGIKLCKPLLNPSLINLKYLGLWNLSNLLFSNSHKPAFVYMFYSPEPCTPQRHNHNIGVHFFNFRKIRTVKQVYFVVFMNQNDRSTKLTDKSGPMASVSVVPRLQIL